MARGLIVLFVGAGVVATACADDPSLDQDAVVAGLPAAVVPDDPSIVADVACPEPEPEVIAQSFTCTASLHGVPITIDVTVDEQAGASTVVREPLYELSTMEAAAAARLGADLGVAVEVVCPGTVIVFAVGATVDCRAVHDDRPLDFVAEIVDTDGNFTLALDPDAHREG